MSFNILQPRSVFNNCVWVTYCMWWLLERSLTVKWKQVLSDICIIWWSHVLYTYVSFVSFDGPMYCIHMSYLYHCEFFLWWLPFIFSWYTTVSHDLSMIFRDLSVIDHTFLNEKAAKAIKNHGVIYKSLEGLSPNLKHFIDMHLVWKKNCL